MTSQDETGKRVLKFSPRTPEAFLPPKQSDAIAEMAAMQRQREVWDQALPILDSLSGKTMPSLNGGVGWDRAKLAFTLQALAQANGYTVLAGCNAAEISRAFTFAYKRNTGDSLPERIAQGNQLRLEHKEAMKNAAE